MTQFGLYFSQCSECEWQDCMRMHRSMGKRKGSCWWGFRFACLLPVINPFMRRQMPTALLPPPPPPGHAPWGPAAAVAVRAQIINLTNCPSDWPNKPSQAHKRSKPKLRFALPKSLHLFPTLAAFNLLAGKTWFENFRRGAWSVSKPAGSWKWIGRAPRMA